jgi:hypothetical protein
MELRKRTGMAQLREKEKLKLAMKIRKKLGNIVHFDILFNSQYRSDESQS